MKSMLKAASIAALLAAATTGMAQPSERAQVFAAQIEQYQSLSGTGSAWTGPPAPTGAPDDPVGNASFAERFAEMQAAASRSSQFQLPRSSPGAARSLASAPFDNANAAPRTY
ncbi:MAG TPA: hypothetical protein VN858_12345 [Casimicrobiaceae bacterium]|jgi:hypothetical protein|nr:hypothetical protein [Casimicrobiaceae bacterium]HXU66388.1 hypothetical protein [Casimicrobiaceae bacterium]